MKRVLAIAGLPLLLGGCIPLLPLPITIASTSLSGFALLTTGKSTPDHVISAARDEDCAMYRVAIGDDICRKYDGTTRKPLTQYHASFPGDHEDWQQVADEAQDDPSPSTAEVPEDLIDEKTGDPWMVSSLAAPITATARVSFDVSSFDAAETVPSGDDAVAPWSEPMSPIAVERVDLPPLPMQRPVAKVEVTRTAIQATTPSSQGVGRFLSLGSFRTTERAVRLKERFAHLDPRILSVDIDGRSWNRVTVGPFGPAEIKRLRRTYATIDGKKTWAFILRK